MTPCGPTASTSTATSSRFPTRTARCGTAGASARASARSRRHCGWAGRARSSCKRRSRPIICSHSPTGPRSPASTPRSRSSPLRPSWRSTARSQSGTPTAPRRGSTSSRRRWATRACAATRHCTRPTPSSCAGPETRPPRTPPTSWRSRRRRTRSSAPSWNAAAPATASLSVVPGREHARTVGGDRDGELEVGGQRAVLGEDRPAVVAHADQVAARVDHRLHGQHHALLELGPAPRLAVVGDLRLLVHRAAYSVADERAHDAQPGLLDGRLHGMRHVPQTLARRALLDGVEQRLLGHVEQLRGDRRDGTDGERPRGVGHPAVLDDADIDADDVAALELVGAGDPVHHHRVRRRADRAREAAIALEGRLGALRADELLGRLVEIPRGDALADLALDQLEGPDKDRPGRGHLVDLLGRLLDDHRDPSTGIAGSQLVLEAKRGDRRPEVVVDLGGRALAVESLEDPAVLVEVDEGRRLLVVDREAVAHDILGVVLALNQARTVLVARLVVLGRIGEDV